MVTMKVKNSLTEEKDVNNVVIIKEGNASVSTIKASVKPGEWYALKMDPNATYREYVLITVANVRVGKPFSSDDAQEYKEIEVTKDGDKYVWKPTNWMFKSMKTVKVKNSLEVDLDVVNIQEGNAGNFTTKESVKPGGTHELKLDLNATHREYQITVANVRVGKPFSSDDAQKYKEIEVTKDGDQYVWKPTSSKHGLIQWFKNLFS